MATLDGPRLPPQRPPATHLVMLLHGYGSDGNDLIGLAPHWQALLPGAAFVSPNAPERCNQSPSGYQWFPLSRIDPQETFKGAETAAPKLNAFIDEELARLKLTDDKAVLVGFSQGAMMALHVGMRRKTPPAAIVGFSGMLVGPERLPKAENPPPVLLLHGDADQVVPPAALFMSANALGAAGVPVQWHLARGLGHGIDPTGLALAGRFITDALRGQRRSGPIATQTMR